MVYPVEWSMDPSYCEWTYDENAQAIMATTITVVCTYFYLGRMHEGVEADVSHAPADVPVAYLGQPLGPWDFLPEPLPNIKMDARICCFGLFVIVTCIFMYSFL